MTQKSDKFLQESMRMSLRGNMWNSAASNPDSLPPPSQVRSSKHLDIMRGDAIMRWGDYLSNLYTEPEESMEDQMKLSKNNIVKLLNKSGWNFKGNYATHLILGKDGFVQLELVDDHLRACVYEREGVRIGDALIDSKEVYELYNIFEEHLNYLEAKRHREFADLLDRIEGGI